MTKKFAGLFVSLLLLAGCGNATARYTDTNELVKFSDGSITKQQIYEMMLTDSGATTAYDLAMNAVFEKEVPVTDEMKETAQQSLDFYKQLYGEGYESMLTSLGVTEEEYVNEYITKGTRRSKLLSNYITEHYEELCTEYHPMSAVIIPVSSNDDSDKIVAALKEGKTISDILTELKMTASTDPVTVLNTDTLLPESVRKAVMSEDTAGKWIRIKISDPSKDPNNASSYIILSKAYDKEGKKEDLVSAFSSDDVVAGKIIGYYFNKYNFQMHDVNLRNAFEKEYPEVAKNIAQK